MNHDDPLESWLLLRKAIELKPEVVAQRQAEAHDAAKYPRVVDSQGKAPAQYIWGDEEGNLEDEEE